MAHWKRDDFNGFRSEIKRHSGDVYDGGSHASFFCARNRAFLRVEGQLDGQSGRTKIMNWTDKSRFLGGAIERG